MKKIPFEYKISFLYVFIGAAWILFSDRLLFQIYDNVENFKLISTLKGWAYVLITGLLLFILVKREITKRNKIYNDLLKANAKAMESDKLKSAFLANLSHYIRTPMNSILGFTDLLQSRNLDDAKKNKFLSNINEKSHQLLQTINNIIEISKIQEGQIELKKQKFRINDLIEKQESQHRHAQPNSEHVKFNFTIPQNSKDEQIIGDQEKISLIIHNLIQNSITYTEKGEIELGYELTGNEVKFFVRDTGHGIKKEDQKLLFNNFLIGPEEIQRIKEGAGLGLYLCSHLCRLMGGRIWLEYSNNTGSKFCFSIPRTT